MLGDTGCFKPDTIRFKFRFGFGPDIYGSVKLIKGCNCGGHSFKSQCVLDMYEQTILPHPERKKSTRAREREGKREGSAVDGEDGWAALIQWAFLIEFHYT